jgi:hypothetical protein
MRKRDIKSQDVNCPICDKLVKTRGLHAHLRLTHPLEDPIYHLRKKVMSPGHVGDQVIFQLSNTIEGQYRIKWASIKTEDVRWLEALFIEWVKSGSCMEFLTTGDNNFKGAYVDSSEEDIKNRILVKKDPSWFIDEKNNRYWDSLRNPHFSADDE